MGLNIEGVKPSHPAKPLDMATTIANSLVSPDSFEATLSLDFEAGLLFAGERLKALAEAGAELVATCTFGPSAGGAV